MERLKSRHISVISFFLITFCLSIGWARPLQCDLLEPIQKYFLKQHVSFTGAIADKSVLKKLERRMTDQYIKGLDPSKLYLLKSDVARIRGRLEGIFKDVAADNCKDLIDIEKILITRVKERSEFTKKVLGKNFKFNKNTELILDPEKRERAKQKADLDKFHEKYLQFQISNYLQSDMKLEEAIGNTLRRYERITKRVEEFKRQEIYIRYLSAFAKSLDPHSSYLSQDMLEDFQISMKLSLEGIGATLSFQDGFTVIEQLIPGGAAFRSGKLEPKDKIIAVGQGKKGVMENVVEMDLRDVVKKIRGKKGTEVRLTILRKLDKGQKRLEVSLLRDKINLEDEAASISYVQREVNGQKLNIGIVRLPSFYAGSSPADRSSAKDMKNLLKEAREKKIHGMLLDLSSNGGGSLEDAVLIAGLFFKRGAVVKEINSRDSKIRKDRDPEVDYAGPLVILTSRISASASEIVAGTLKDYKRALIVGGDHTFGKGSIQSVATLPQKLGATKVTVGMFFIPGGDSTQHKGVSADIVFPGVFSTDEFGEKTLDYSLPPKKTPTFISPEAYVDSGPGAWKKIEPWVVDEVREKATKRIAANEEFKKIIKSMKEARAREKDKIVKLSDLMKESDEDKKKEEKEKKENLRFASKEEKFKVYMKRADVLEATEIVTDLVQTLNKKSNLLGAVKGKLQKNVEGGEIQ